MSEQEQAATFARAIAKSDVERAFVAARSGKLRTHRFHPPLVGTRWQSLVSKVWRTTFEGELRLRRARLEDDLQNALMIPAFVS